jgi:phosphatidylinositol-3-phosphatase
MASGTGGLIPRFTATVLTCGHTALGVLPVLRVRPVLRTKRWPLVRSAAVLAAAALALAACGSAAPHTSASSGSGPATAPASAGQNASARTPAGNAGQAATLPAIAHTVVVVMENHSYGEVIGNPQAPYINQLAGQGTVFTNSHAVAHPSEPNYLALFSGSTQGVSSDSCPVTFDAANLASELIAAHKTFTGYAESLPAAGGSVCSSGEYARKHVPWVDFSNVPPSATQSLTSFPTGNYGQLPDVSFVIPNLCHDMHDCSVATGDSWLKRTMGGYATWAQQHASLLIVTWDEDDGSASNQIPTIFVGQQVRTGKSARPITHYSVLHTIESLYRLPPNANAATAAVITSVWR